MKLFQLALFAVASLSAIDSFSTYENAKFYYDHSGQQWSVAFDALNGYPFRGDEKVLEIGCRGGRVAANLAGRVPQGMVVGAEMRGDGAIAFAKENHSPLLYPNLSFLQQDFRNSGSKEDYDLIVSFSALHWFPDQKEILQVAHSALKQGGEIFFTIPGKPLPEIDAIIARLLGKEEWSTYFVDYLHPRRKFGGEEYTTLLAEVGFHPLKIELERHSYFFESKRDLIDWFRAFSPILDRVPDELKEQFLVDFANTYTLTYPITAKGQIPFHQDELFIHAKK